MRSYRRQSIGKNQIRSGVWGRMKKTILAIAIVAVIALGAVLIILNSGSSKSIEGAWVVKESNGVEDFTHSNIVGSWIFYSSRGEDLVITFNGTDGYYSFVNTAGDDSRENFQYTREEKSFRYTDSMMSGECLVDYELKGNELELKSGSSMLILKRK